MDEESPKLDRTQKSILLQQRLLKRKQAAIEGRAAELARRKELREKRSAARAESIARDERISARALARVEAIADLEKLFPDDKTLECEACHREKGVDDYLEMRSELDPNAPSPQVCDHCRRFGPPVKDPTAKLTPQELRAMQIIVAGGTLRDAATITGIHNSDLSKMVRGKVMPHFRAAMQAILYDKGLTVDKLSDVLMKTLDADQPKWNPAEKRWDFFPDHTNRRGTARDLLKMMGAEEPKEQSIKANDTGGLVVQIMTNIGAQGAISDVPGTLVARASQQKAIDAEYEEED